MIVLKVEMWPKGDEKRAYVLAKGFISNNGQATLIDPSRGDYKFELSGGVVGRPKLTERTWKAGKASIDGTEFQEDELIGGVSGFDRRRRGVWDLLYLCLKKAVGSRNP